MAKKKATDTGTTETPPVPAIEAEATYKVTLTRAVPYGRMMLRPQDDVRLKGKVVAALGDAVAAYEKL